MNTVIPDVRDAYSILDARRRKTLRAGYHDRRRVGETKHRPNTTPAHGVPWAGVELDDGYLQRAISNVAINRRQTGNFSRSNGPATRGISPVARRGCNSRDIFRGRAGIGN